MAEMRAIVEQLQSQVEAQSEQIDHQGEVIRDARLEQSREDDSRFGASGITSFLQRLEIEGHIAGSYFWNWNNPQTGGNKSGFNPQANQGDNGLAYPFHGSHNSFQVDQVWFGIEHPIDEENRAGFRFDLVYGTTALNLGNARGLNQGTDADCWNNATSCMYVSQAYIQYLIPFTSNGIEMKAGKFDTLVGAEVEQTNANYNITRGLLYSVMQPIDHVGVMFDSKWGESGFNTAIGVVNSGVNGRGSDWDYDKSKAVIGQFGWTGETLGAATTVIWGHDNRESGKWRTVGLVDFVMTWDPNERISTYLNFDYGWREAQGFARQAYGVGVAGRFAVTERFGLSSRFEWLGDKRGYAGWNAGGDYEDTTDVFSLTSTADYAITNNLMIRGEVRWDTTRGDNNAGQGEAEFYGRPDGNLKRNQVTTGMELVYEF
jgi:hypothetical protein